MNKENSKPPRIAEFILSLFMRSEVEKNRLGDFEEIYQNIKEDEGTLKAWKWYWGQAILSIPVLIYNQIYWRITMLKNYIKIAFRNLRKHKMSSIINISSLAVTMVSCIFIFLYVWNEFNYDNYQKDYNRIYRIATIWQGRGHNRTTPNNTAPVVPVLKAQFPEVEEAVRVFTIRQQIIKYEDKVFYETNGMYADDDFLKMFSIPILKGESTDPLKRPNTIVLSQSISEKYFGIQNPIGKLLSINDMFFEVTAVVENSPENTHLKYNFITSTKNRPDIENETNWTRFNCFSYIKLASETDVNTFSNKIKNMSDAHHSISGMRYIYFLQPLADIHLKSNLSGELEPGGNIQSIYIFIAVGLLILLLGCMNFVNLVTAQSADRIKEVGIRKVAGAKKHQIIYQFIGESILISFFALVTALIIVIILLPYFNQFAGSAISVSKIFQFSTLSFFIGIVLLTGLAAGFVPSWLISKYSPVAVLKGRFGGKVNRNSLRKTLIVFQFVISNLLVIGTVIMFQQLNFMKNQELGFNKVQKLIVPAGPAFTMDNYETLKGEFTKNSSINSVSVSAAVLGDALSSYSIRRINEPQANVVTLNSLSVDMNYLSDYNIQIFKGRSFKKEYSSDFVDACLINETAVKTFGWSSAEEAIGKKISYNSNDNIRTVVGVVKDFHFTSLHEKIGPLFVELINSNTGRIRWLNLTLSGSNLQSTVQFVKEKWCQLNPGLPFRYFFLDEQFDQLYKRDEKLGGICSAFTFVALSIAYFGLIGLISFTARKRMKEISVRKVLGASLSQLVLVLSKETAKSVLLANIITWPIAYLIMNNWLQDFPYRISISIWTMIFSGLLIFFIAFASISVRCIKTASANPVDSLRNE